MEEKPLVWLKGEVKSPPLSSAARIAAGVLLRRLQRGETLSMPHSRPMRSVGPRCHELRFDDAESRAETLQSSLPALRRSGGRIMKDATRKRLRETGWAVGSAAELLDLSAEEAAYVDLKLALSDSLRRERERAGLSQAELARRLGSSQSRVSRMETADASVTVDLLIRSLLSLGASRRELGRIVASERRTA